jgi:hypothetical protein
MKNFLILGLVCFPGLLISQGLVLDNETYLNAEKWSPSESQGYASGDMPTTVSYRKFAPNIADQGSQSTCVGWAVSYAQLSTQQNLLMGVSNRIEKCVRSMDPYYVYNYINGDRWCQEGTLMVDAMTVLKMNGTKPFVWDPWLKCNAKVTFSKFTNALASNYTIRDFYTLGRDNIAQNTKMALANGFIVSVGMNLTESFQASSAYNSGVWSPSSGEKYIGGHAMCVIGYDNYKYGGSFEVMNSWGKEYGDNGFIWIKYSDFEKHVDQAWIMDLENFREGNCSMGDCYNSYSRFKYDNGTIYEGLVENGYPNVYGAFTYNNGDFYIGQVNQGRRHGYGTYYLNEEGTFYTVRYNMDDPMSYTVKQGYASEEEIIAQEQLSVLVEIVPDSRIETDLKKIEDFIHKAVVPEKPLIINLE